MTDERDETTGGPDGAATPAGSGAGDGTGADGAAGAGDGKGGKAGEPADTRSAFDKRLDKILEDDDATGAGDGEGDGDGGGSGEDDDAGKGADGAPAGDESTATGGEADDKTGKGKTGAAAAAAAGKGAEDEAEPVKLSFPGRKPDDKDLEVEVDADVLAILADAAGVKPQELVERFAQLRNGYGRRQEVEAERRQTQAERASIDRVHRELKAAPVDFFLDRVAPTEYAAIAEALLTRVDEETFNAIAEKVAAWEQEPVGRERAGMQAERAATKRRDDRTTAEASERARTEFANKVSEQITNLVPEDWDEDRAGEFYEFAAHKLSVWGGKQPKGTKLDPAAVPGLLEELGALEPYGLTLPDPAAPGKTAPKGKTGQRPASSTPSKKDAAAAAEQARTTLQQRRDRRRAATTTQAGAGATAASSALPKVEFGKPGQFDRRMDALKKKLGIGK